jgi:hypothetical protein
MLKTDYKGLLYRMKVLNIKKDPASSPKARPPATDVKVECA